MKNYRVNVPLDISLSLVIEAESDVEVRDKE